MSKRFAEQHGTQGGRTTGVNRCASSGTERQGQLATIREVLELLRNGGADFTDLEPIRTRYRQQFGDERCQVCPVCHNGYLGVVFLPVQEGTLCLPYDAVTSDMMEQFVLDEAHLLDCEECGQLLQELNTQYVSLSTELETIHAKLKGDTSGRKEKSHLESVSEEVNKYVFEAGHCVSVQRPINDISRELVQAMAEAYETPVYLGTYESDQLTPYTGQQICNLQYNFCVPVDSKELKCRLRFGIHSAMEFEGFYQLLISLGGHILFWR